MVERPVALQLMVADADKTYADAIAAGATSKMPPNDASGAIVTRT